MKLKVYYDKFCDTLGWMECRLWGKQFLNKSELESNFLLILKGYIPLTSKTSVIFFWRIEYSWCIKTIYTKGIS